MEKPDSFCLKQTIKVNFAFFLPKVLNNLNLIMRKHQTSPNWEPLYKILSLLKNNKVMNVLTALDWRRDTQHDNKIQRIIWIGCFCSKGQNRDKRQHLHGDCGFSGHIAPHFLTWRQVYPDYAADGACLWVTSTNTFRDDESQAFNLQIIQYERENDKAFTVKC